MIRMATVMIMMMPPKTQSLSLLRSISDHSAAWSLCLSPQLHQCQEQSRAEALTNQCSALCYLRSHLCIPSGTPEVDYPVHRCHVQCSFTQPLLSFIFLMKGYFAKHIPSKVHFKMMTYSEQGVAVFYWF